MRDAAAERAGCAAEIAAAERVDPVRLGMDAATLRAARPDLRREASGSHVPTDPDPAALLEARQAAGLDRWVRDGAGQVVRFEYEVWQDHVYRIRWRLAPAFERPVFAEFVRRATICLGPPESDQLFEAEPGSPRATLRRAVWSHGDRVIELRQLHPLRGGPVYLTVTRQGALREIAAVGGALYPEPDRNAPWWQRSMRVPEPVTSEERVQLGAAFVILLSQVDH